MKKDIELYSNPKLVLKMAKKIYGNDVNIDYSTKKDKKYMILNPNTNKWVHFGQMFYEDYTKHKNIQRRDNFRKRNNKWEHTDKYSPSFMSFHILWT